MKSAPSAEFTRTSARRIAFAVRWRWWLFPLFLAGHQLAVARGAAPPPSGVDAGLRFLEERVKADPDDFIAHNQLVTRYLNQLRETGDYAWLSRARAAAEASLAAIPAEQNTGGLAALARVQLAQHRFAEAAESAKKLALLTPQKTASQMILGDALLEFGETEQARRAYEKLGQNDPGSVDTGARLARLSQVAGDFKAAREHLLAALAAARQLVPESPETIAWCEVRLGELAFAVGDWDEAGKQYQAALVTFPDYYAALDHLAELHGARGEFDRARELYEALVKRLPRPEFFQALGDLLVFAGNPDEAKPWHDRALAGFLGSVEAGEVHYLHHLAGFFADVREDAAAAVKYAQQDLALRHTSAAHEMLGWALFRGGDHKAARAAMEEALGTGGRSAHLFHHAGMVFSAAGQFERGQKLMREALALNPRYHAFHVHR